MRSVCLLIALSILLVFCTGCSNLVFGESASEHDKAATDKEISMLEAKISELEDITSNLNTKISVLENKLDKVQETLQTSSAAPSGG